jgi:hypothetical protein
MINMLYFLAEAEAGKPAHVIPVNKKQKKFIQLHLLNFFL